MNKWKRYIHFLYVILAGGLVIGLSPLGSVLSAIIFFLILVLCAGIETLNPRHKGIRWLIHFSSLSLVKFDLIFWRQMAIDVLSDYGGVIAAVLCSPLFISYAKWF